MLDEIQFFKNATTAGESAYALKNPNLGSQLIVQVSGSATAFELDIKGAINGGATIQLGCIDMSSYSVSNKITANGIYVVAVDGISNISAELKSVTGGNVSAYARLGGA